MRRFLIFPLLLLLLFSLAACVSPDRIDLSVSETVSSPSPIGSETLGQKLASGDSFALLVSSTLCSACQEFSPLLDEIILSEQILVFEIVVENDEFPTDNPLAPYRYTPTFFLFRNGELLSGVDAFSDPEIFATKTSFTRYLRKYVIL